MADLKTLSIDEISTLFQQGALTPTNLAVDIIERAKNIQNSHNFMAYFNEDYTMTQANAATERWQAGTQKSAYDGILFTVKDVFDVRDMPTRKGSKTTSHTAATQNHYMVERLEAMGCVFLCKTTLCEFGHKGVTDSPLHGITRNPHNKDKTSGGSSGGAAVATFYNLGHIHLGNDGGGSVRIPASFCGVFGYKATQNAIPDNSIKEDTTLKEIDIVSCGFLSRDYDDLLHGYNIICGERVSKANTKKLSIAHAETLNDFDVAPDIQVAFSDYCDKLSQTHSMTPITFSYPTLLETMMTLWTIDVRETVRAIGIDKVDDMDRSIQKWMGWAESVSDADYQKALIHKQDLKAQVLAQLQPYDLFIMPTLPITAFDVGRNSPPKEEAMNLGPWWTPFTAPFNLTGQPALSIPIGFDTKNLPIGAQIIGKNGYDEELLSLVKSLI